MQGSIAMIAARVLRACAAAALLAAPQAGWPVFDPVNDDTDIFLANPAFVQTRPNVLFIVDNSANWSSNTGLAAPWNTKWGGIQQALIAIANDPSIVNSDFNIGIMLYGETGTGNNNDGGAYVRYGIRQMTGTTADATSNLGRFVQLVTALNGNSDKTNNTEYSLSMYEAFQYFAGLNTYGGHGKAKADTGGYVYVTGLGTPRVALAGSPLPAGKEASGASVGAYTSPIVDACQKNFIIYLSNGKEQDGVSVTATAQDFLAGITGINPPTTIPLSPNGEVGLWADEFAKFMANGDCSPAFDGSQHVFTYAVDVIPDDASHTAMLQSMAYNGKGKYFAVTDTSSTAQLQGFLKNIFQEVQAVNSVFASTTLPVSVNVRGTNLNQVYIGVFRPDQNKNPRWLGNLKLYKLGVSASTGNLFLADSTGAAAENSSTGFISGNATSFWTDTPATNSYWSFRPAAENGVGLSSDWPDGDLVEKGGAAQRIRKAYPTSQAARDLYTCVNATFDGPCAGGTLLSTKLFDNTNISAADLGAFKTYAVSSISCCISTPAANTATLRLTAAPDPVWADTNPIKIEGATPDNFNGTYNLTSVDNATFTYTFTLTSVPDTTSAQATGTSHGLQTGDSVTVTGGVQFNVVNASVTRIDNNTFRYSTGTAVSGSAGANTASGRKTVSSITGSGTTATAVLPSHGYANLSTVVISGNVLGEAMLNTPLGATITFLTNDSFSYTTTATIAGTQSVAKAIATSHNLSNGQSNVYIVGNVDAVPAATPYNGGPKTVQRQDANTVTFPTTDTTIGTASGVIGVKITSFAHPTSGGGNGTGCGARDVLTIVTDGAHNITGPFPFSITIAGGTNEGAGKDFTFYNGTWSLSAQADAPVSPGNTITITQTSTTNSSPAGTCNFDSGGTGSGGTAIVPATTVVAGKPITGGITAVTTATGSPLYASKSVSLSGITALATASGSMTAGRTGDGDNSVGGLRDQIVAWVRGADNITNENPDTDTTPAGSDVRPSVHGDVLHSRPAVVNYNRYGDDNDVYAFYGSNDGIFHALKGGIANHTTGADTLINPGSERWGFIPREFFSKLKRLRDQSPAITNVTQKDYFADGSIGIYQQDRTPDGSGGCTSTADGKINSTTCDKVYLYMTMRRGGAFIYALDVTNPAAPKLLWRKSSLDVADGWGQLGQTWSEPKVSRSAASLGNTGNPDNVVLIFGAGYDDAVEDFAPCLLSQSTTTHVLQKNIGTGSVTYTAAGSCVINGGPGTTSTVTRSKGRGILVVDAFDGTVIWQASAGVSTSAVTPITDPLTIKRDRKLNVPGMTCAIPSDVTVLDKDRNGTADRVYVGDTCGQVWRLDISNTNMDEWTATKIAAISSSAPIDTPTAVAHKRKFLFPPDLVFGVDPGNYTAVLLGSGDREHPFDGTVVNRFYMFKDRGDSLEGATNSSSVKIAPFCPPPAVACPPTGSVLTDSDVFDATSAVLVDGTDPQGLNGWKITLGAGEKAVSSATSVAGTVFFNTNQPSATAGGSGVTCTSNLGVARSYLVGFADAGATVDVNGTGGITIADRSTIHEGGGYLPSPVPVVVEIDGQKYQAVISGTAVQTPPGLTLEKRSRAFWYKQID